MKESFDENSKESYLEKYVSSYHMRCNLVKWKVMRNWEKKFWDKVKMIERENCLKS